MRKRFVPIIIAVIVTMLTLWGHFEVKSTVSNAITQLNEIKIFAEQDNFSGAETAIKKLLCDFDAKQHLLELFIKRESISAVSVNLHGLKAYATKDTAQDLLSEIDKAIEQLNMLQHLFFSIL